MFKAENLGIGLGLRIPHYPYIFENMPSVDFFEIISENFMVDGGPPITNLERILEHYPVIQHGVSLSIASAEPLDFEYLKKLKKLTKITKTPWLSDHLCWSRCNSHNYHDLLPIPYTEKYAALIAEKARIVQDFLELPFALENLSTYVSFKDSQMTEWEFVRTVIEKANCHLMLDVNNVYVSSVNHNFDPMEYINAMPMDRIVQMHIAGHSTLEDGTCLDTHDHPVNDATWELYREVYRRTGGVSTLLEWDDNFLSFEETLAEAHKAKKFQAQLDLELGEAQNELKNFQLNFGSSMATPFSWKDDARQCQIDKYHPETLANIEETPARKPEQRMASYNEQYWFRLLTIMQQEHPLLRHILGVYQFNQLATDYLDKFPSEKHSLSFLSDRLPEFLQQSKKWGSELHQQIASIELAYIKAFDAAKEAVLDIGNNKEVDLLQNSLLFQSSFHLLEEDWNLVESYQTAQEDDDDEIAITPEKGKSFWALYRSSNIIHEEKLLPIQYEMLTLLKKGKSLEETFAQLEETLNAEEVEFLEQNLQSWFSRWMSLSWFVNPN